MNGIYMTMVMIGVGHPYSALKHVLCTVYADNSSFNQSFLTPMAAGTQATRSGWRSSYATLGIFNAIFLVLFVFLYEETKYVPIITGQAQIDTPQEDIPENTEQDRKSALQSDTKISVHTGPSNLNHELDPNIPLNSWRKRLALITPTPEPIYPYYCRPFYILLSFPAVLFAALQYAAGVIWLTITSSVLSLVFPRPPYNFTPEQIGFMSVGPFVGNLIGAIYGGVLGDWSILFFSRRNKGFYEPEMRLYILHIPAIAMSGGLIMFGTTIARVSLHGTHLVSLSVFICIPTRQSFLCSNICTRSVY